MQNEVQGSGGDPLSSGYTLAFSFIGLPRGPYCLISQIPFQKGKHNLETTEAKNKRRGWGRREKRSAQRSQNGLNSPTLGMRFDPKNSWSPALTCLSASRSLPGLPLPHHSAAFLYSQTAYQGPLFPVKPKPRAKNHWPPSFPKPKEPKAMLPLGPAWLDSRHLDPSTVALGVGSRENTAALQETTGHHCPSQSSTSEFATPAGHPGGGSYSPIVTFQSTPIWVPI